MNLCRGYVCHPCSSGSGTMCKKKCCAIRPGKAGTGESAALCRWRRLKKVTWLLRLQQGSTVLIRSQVTAKGRWRQSWVTDRVCTSSPLCCGFAESLRYQRIANSVQLTGLRFIFTARYEDGNGLSCVIVVGFATILILDLIQTIYYSSANTNETSKLVSH